MSYRDARVCRGGYTGRNSGYYFPFDSRFHQGFGLFAPSAENERITAFQSGYSLTRASPLDQQVVDLVLWNRRHTCLLTNVDQLGSGPGVSEYHRVNKVVIDNDVASPYCISAADSQ
jgi:hypothetical protein